MALLKKKRKSEPRIEEFEREKSHHKNKSWFTLWNFHLLFRARVINAIFVPIDSQCVCIYSWQFVNLRMSFNWTTMTPHNYVKLSSKQHFSSHVLSWSLSSIIHSLSLFLPTFSFVICFDHSFSFLLSSVDYSTPSFSFVLCSRTESMWLQKLLSHRDTLQTWLMTKIDVSGQKFRRHLMYLYGYAAIPTSF